MEVEETKQMQSQNLKWSTFEDTKLEQIVLTFCFDLLWISHIHCLILCRFILWGKSHVKTVNRNPTYLHFNYCDVFMQHAPKSQLFELKRLIRKLSYNLRTISSAQRLEIRKTATLAATKGYWSSHWILNRKCISQNAILFQVYLRARKCSHKILVCFILSLKYWVMCYLRVQWAVSKAALLS